MAAATQPIETPEKSGSTNRYKIAASTVIYKGIMVALNAAGFAIPAADTASTKVVGIADETVDNSGGAAGDASVLVKKGAFKLKNSESNAVAQANVHANCVVADNQTVSMDTTNDIVAGRVESVEADGVWVLFQ